MDVRSSLLVSDVGKRKRERERAPERKREKRERLVLDSSDSLFPRALGGSALYLRRSFQLEAPQDSQLLLDCNLRPATKGKKQEGKIFQHTLLQSHVISRWSDFMLRCFDYGSLMTDTIVSRPLWLFAALICYLNKHLLNTNK